MAQRSEVIIRFDEVSFAYKDNKPILEETDFSVRRGSKIALMGQNGAGKSTIFQLVTGSITQEDGFIHMASKESVAISKQVVPKEYLDLSVRAFFEKSFDQKVYDIDPKIDAVLEVVHLHAPKEKIVRSFSGGQQARLLLAAALIQDPDVLLLDEPTNNLDKAGIEHLTDFLRAYKKTVIVISHDADFLNAFTEGVLYLDVFTQKVEQYVGNYKDVVREISARVEKERRKNTQLQKHIQSKKEKANFFANKGGRMRVLAKRMRESAEEAEETMVDVRREDKTIRPFTIETSKLSGEVLHIDALSVMKDHIPTDVEANISLTKNEHLLLMGPNGIGKTTLLEQLAHGGSSRAWIKDDVRVGYYRQDFSTLDFDQTVYATLESVMDRVDEQRLRSVAAGFLITEDIIFAKVGDLSEGQKGLVAFAQLVLLKPGILILDEPTNHINFRHTPVIAKAIDQYEGAMVLVSHVPEFVDQIRIDKTLDIQKLKPVKKPKNKKR